MKIIVQIKESEEKKIEVKSPKKAYELYEKMAAFVDDVEKIYNRYNEEIAPEIIENLPDDFEEMVKFADKQTEISIKFYNLFQDINNICFSTVDRAYGIDD